MHTQSRSSGQGPYLERLTLSEVTLAEVRFHARGGEGIAECTVKVLGVEVSKGAVSVKQMVFRVEIDSLRIMCDRCGEVLLLESLPTSMV